MTPDTTATANGSADLPPPPPRWRRLLPAWLRALIWVEESNRFDAFLSYSWAADVAVAPAIQSVLERFLCPWYRVRTLRVFRDLSTLPAGDTVEGALRANLDRSELLIVLASPEAATSRGMELEAEHWLSTIRRGHVLIIVTAGEFDSWNDIRDRLLPQSLAKALVAEPVWADIRHRRSALVGALSSTVREELVEDLRQVILRFHPGKDWGTLRGKERNARRNALALLWAVVLALTAISLAAIWQYRAANTNRNEAQLRLAHSMVAEGYALGRAGRWREGRQRIREASDLFDSLSVSPFPAQLADWFTHTESPMPIRTFAAHRNSIVGVRAFPDGGLLSVDRDGAFVRRDLITGEIATASHIPIEEFSPVLLTRDASMLVGGDVNTLSAYRTSDGTQAWTFDKAQAIDSLAQSPSGKRLLIAGFLGLLRVLDLANGHELQNLDVSDQPFNIAEFVDENTIAVATDSEVTIRSLRGSNSDVILPARQVTTIVAGAELVTGHQDGTIRVWSLPSDRTRTVSPRLVIRAHTGAVSTAAISPDGTSLVSGGVDGLVRVWGLGQGDLLHSWADHASVVSTIEFVDVTHIVSGDGNGTVKVWSMQRAADRRQIGAATALGMLAMSDDGRLALVEDKAWSTRVVDVETGAVVHSLIGQTFAVALHPSGRDLTFGHHSDPILRTIDLQTGQERVLHRDDRKIDDVRYSGDGALVAASYPGSVLLLNSTTGGVVRELQNVKSVLSLATDHTGNTILLEDDRRLFVWATASDVAVELTACGTNTPQRFALSSTGKLAMCSDRDAIVHIVDTVTNVILGSLKGHSGEISAVSFGIGDRYAITSAGDGTIRFWDLDTNGELLTLQGRADEISVQPSGMSVIAGRDQVELLELARPTRSASLAAVATDVMTSPSEGVDWATRARLVEWYALRNECGWAIRIARDLPPQHYPSLAIGHCAVRQKDVALAAKAFGAVPKQERTAYIQLWLNRALKKFNERPDERGNTPR